MRNLRVVVSALLASMTCGFVASTQEPAPAPPPAATAGTKQDVPGAPVRSPLEGVYELRRRRIDGRIDERACRGHVAITQRHLFLCLAAPGPDAEHPLLRSGVRTWSQKKGSDVVDAVVKLGWFTDAEGRLHVEEPATKEARRMVLEGNLLRIVQDARNDLEFERVE